MEQMILPEDFESGYFLVSFMSILKFKVDETRLCQ